ncbi:MAG: hypothetical protein J5I50_09810 [Chitinophagaceae bacterium]|nr:hypothetical protein [Chitinophagaceae bacterium]
MDFRIENILEFKNAVDSWGGYPYVNFQQALKRIIKYKKELSSLDYLQIDIRLDQNANHVCDFMVSNDGKEIKLIYLSTVGG